MLENKGEAWSNTHNSGWSRSSAKKSYNLEEPSLALSKHLTHLLLMSTPISSTSSLNTSVHSPQQRVPPGRIPPNGLNLSSYWFTVTVIVSPTFHCCSFCSILRRNYGGGESKASALIKVCWRLKEMVGQLAWWNKGLSCETWLHGTHYFYSIKPEWIRE